MKKAFVLVSLAMSLMACSKEDSPIVNAEPTVPRDSLDWTLDFSTPMNNIGLKDMHPYDTKKLVGWHDEQVGNVFYFSDGQYNFTVLFFWYTFEGEDVRLTGNLNGHSFIMSNCKFNVCNGPNGVVMIYTLKDHTGKVRSTCTATNS